METTCQHLESNILTRTQINLWLEWKLEPASSAYNNPLLYRIEGEINPEKMQQTLQWIVDRYRALRFVVNEVAGMPQALWLDSVNVTMSLHDFSLELPEQADSLAQQQLKLAASEPFDLANGPLFRFVLVRESVQKYWFLANIHHIAVDGVSAELLMEQISIKYAQLTTQTTANHELVTCDSVAYSRFVHMTESEHEDVSKYVSYWQSQLEDAQTVVNFSKPLTRYDANEARRIALPALDLHTTTLLKRQARQQGTSLFLFLLAVYYKTLSHFVNQYDMTINYPQNYRDAQHKDLFGCFISYLSVRIHGDSQTSLSDVIKKLGEKRKQLKGLNLSKLIATKSQALNGGEQINSNVSFTQANFVSNGLIIDGAKVSSVQIFVGESIDDIALFYDDSSGRLEVQLAYNPQVVEAQLVQNLANYFMSYVQALAFSDKTEIDTVVPKSCDYQLSILNGPELKCEADLLSNIAHHAQAQPNKLAIIGANGSYTYAQLYQVAGCYAQQLLDLSITKPVMVRLHRTKDLVAVLLACQWAGITYIPLDLATPAQRIEVIAKDSGSEHIITIADDLVDQIGTITRIHLIESAQGGESAQLLPILPKYQISDFEEGNISSQKSGYIIYTSGSTGVPKGVEIANISLTNFLSSSQKLIGVSENDHWVAITTIGFDISAMELYLPLWCGASLTIVDDLTHKDPFELKKLLNECTDVTIMQATPAMWQMLLDAGWKGQRNLTALSGGEPLPQGLADELQDHMKTIWNMYGPTEATIWCTLREVQQNQPITIGKPFHNTQLAIVDQKGNILPLGAKGELVIAGIQLAKGYVNRDELNRKQFSPLSAPTSSRFYRTGDIASFTFDGEIQIFGRADKQIKLNGYRIELGEIESCLRKIDGVRQAAVLLHNKRLIGCVCPTEAHDLGEERLLTHLAALLPSYMLPRRIVFVDEMPLNNSGKVDRKVILDNFVTMAEHESIHEQEDVKWRNEYELTIASVFRVVLANSNILPNTSIFAYGGDSLKATRILALVSDNFKQNVSLADFMQQPTVRHLAQMIIASEVENKVADIPVEVDSQETYWALSYTQEQILFLERYANLQDEYNMAAMMHCEGGLTEQQLASAWHYVLNQHPILMVQFSTAFEELSQYIQPVSLAEVVADIEIAQAQSESHARLALQQWATKRFDVFVSPLWRLAMQKVSDGDLCLVGLCIHHSIADGMSVPMILDELAYALQRQDQTLTMACSSTQFDYFTYAKEDRNRALSAHNSEYWKDLLTERQYLQYPSLPNMQLNDGVDRSAKQITQVVGKDLWYQIGVYCQNNGLSRTSFVVGASTLALAEFCQQTDFCVGIPTSMRTQSKYLQTVGCFLNLLPLKVDLVRSNTQLEYMRTIQNGLTQALAYQLPFAQLLKTLGVSPEPNRMPLFNTILNIQEDYFYENVSNNGNTTVTPITPSHSLYDVSILGLFSKEQLSLSIDYQTAKISQEDVQRLIQSIMLWIHKLLDIHCDELPQFDTQLNEKQQSKQSKKNKFKQGLTTQLHHDAAVLWLSVLDTQCTDLSDNFFYLGGESLRAARLIRATEEQLGVLVSLPQFLADPTLDHFCQLIERARQSEGNYKMVYCRTQALTPNQQTLAIFYQSQITNVEHTGSMYHLALQVKCLSELNISRLNEAVECVLNRHPMYKASISLDMSHFDFVEHVKPEVLLIQGDDQAVLQADVKSFSEMPFELTKAPLTRFALLSESNEDWALVVVCHHLIADEWSLQLLLQEIFDAYQESEDVTESVSKLIYEQCGNINSNIALQATSQSFEYWQNYWQAWQPSRLPETSRPNIQALPVKGDLITMLNNTAQRQLEELAKNHDVSLAQAAMTVFLINVAHFCGIEQPCVMTTYDRRMDLATQQWHGYLVNLIPIGLQLDNISTLAGLLDNVKHTVVRGIEHSAVDFSELLDKHIAPQVGMVFSFQHQHDIHYQGELLDWSSVDNLWAKYPLTFIVREQQNGINITVEFDQRFYSVEYIDLFVRAFEQLLISTAQFQQQAYQQWCFGDSPLTLTSDSVHLCEPSCSLLEEIFHTHVHQDFRPALCFGENTYSYAELYAAVLKIQQHLRLIAPKGISGKKVIVSLTNGPEFIVSILAVMSAGGWFVPVRADEVVTRKHFIVKDTDACLVLAQSTNFRDFKNEQQVPVVMVDTLEPFAPLTIKTVHGIELNLAPESSGYVIYTSGTTGQPKGVLIDEKSLHRTILGIQQKVQVNSLDRGLQFSSISFDASLYEIFTILLNHASLIIPTQAEFGVGEKLETFIRQKEISFTLLTPTVLNTINPKSLPSLRIVQSGGEACTDSLVAKWAKQVMFFNAYGPSEAAICCAINHVSEHSSVNCIGTPIGKAKLSVVNEAGVSLPEGAIGELLISGDSVGLGYLNRPELTERQFKTCKGQLSYKSGDRARIIGGYVYCFGRTDRQVKLNGLRIELGEIEQVVQGLLGVEQSICHVWQQQLVLHYKAQSDITERAIIAHARAHLNAYMVPSICILHQAELPINSNGKVDIRALETLCELMKSDNKHDEMDESDNEIEQQVHAIWHSVLNNDALHSNLDFFRCGGNSIHILQICSAISQQLAVDFGPEVFISYPTIKLQSQYISDLIKQETQFTLENIINEFVLLNHEQLIGISKAFKEHLTE